MKFFYTETDQLISINRTFRYVFNETDDGQVSFLKIFDPETKEEIMLEEMRNTSPDAILNLTTAYRANYKRTYFDGI